MEQLARYTFLYMIVMFETKLGIYLVFSWIIIILLHDFLTSVKIIAVSISSIKLLLKTYEH